MLRNPVAVPAMLVVVATLLAALSSRADEFLGPFPSWANVKAEFGAVGDGRADDTAAIQEALYALRRKDSPKKVLYFPAGTYRITGTLRLERISHHEPLGMSIAGEDPERTVILWDGPAGGSMFLYDAWYASLSRLTFDGRGRAKTAVEHGPNFATANECTDVIIKDVEFGIEAGKRDGIAETAILRCRFYRCSKAAISIQNFNSLDWYIWDSWFEDCGVGVTNEFGAGNFHVFQSTFLRSKDADITIRHTGYLSFADNVSIGSNRFFHAKRAGNWKANETWGSQATLQANLILDPKDPTPVVIENNGPNLLLDNRIRARGEGPIVRNEPPSDRADLICVGNNWTAREAIQVRGRVTAVDNWTVGPRTIRDARPRPVPFAARAERPIIEVAPGASVETVQAAIDRAAGMKGRRPVVHLARGDYRLARTLVVPAGADLQLVGDGPENATQLFLSGGPGPLIRIQGPSHATFRNFLAKAGREAVAIQVEGCDQPGARVFGEQLNPRAFEAGIATEGLRNAWVELRDAGHNGLHVTGAGPATATWVALFAGASSRSNGEKAGVSLYDVRNGGKLLVRDIWYEGHAYSMLNLTDSGEFAYHSAYMAPYDPNHGQKLDWEEDFRPTVVPIQVDGFRGRVALTLVSMSDGDLRIKRAGRDLQLYLLGYKGRNTAVDLGDPAGGEVVCEHMRLAPKGNATGGLAADGRGKASPSFVREMLKALREVRPRPLAAPREGVTDVRFYRIWSDGRIGFLVRAAAGE